MVSGLSSIRLRLAEVIERAESDEEFRKRLESDQAGVFKEYGIPEGAVEEFSQQLQHAQRQGVDLASDPTDCINTNGCSDFTCFSSTCGPTCYITILISQPDS